MSENEMEYVATMLADTRWGEYFSPKELEKLSHFMTVRRFTEGQTVFSQGDTERYLAFIIKGNIDIAKDIGDSLERVVVSMRPKTHFGELSFVDGKPRSASAVAKGAVTVLFFPRERFEDLLKTDKDLGIKIQEVLLKSVCARLRMTTHELVKD